MPIHPRNPWYNYYRDKNLALALLWWMNFKKMLLVPPACREVGVVEGFAHSAHTGNEMGRCAHLGSVLVAYWLVWQNCLPCVDFGHMIWKPCSFFFPAQVDSLWPMNTWLHLKCTDVID